MKKIFQMVLFSCAVAVALNWGDADGSPATQPIVAGKYAEASKADDGGLYASMPLDFHADGTVVCASTLRDRKTKHESEGTWTQTGAKITLSIRKLDGKPIPADRPRIVKALTVANDGKRLVPADGGPDFDRK